MTGIKLTQSDLDYYYMKVHQEQDEWYMYYEQEWHDEYCGCPKWARYQREWN